jgi:hypothetical protein
MTVQQLFFLKNLSLSLARMALPLSCPNNFTLTKTKQPHHAILFMPEPKTACHIIKLDLIPQIL